MTPYEAELQQLRSPAFVVRVGPPGWRKTHRYDVAFAVEDLGDGVCHVVGLARPESERGKTLLPHVRAAVLLAATRGYRRATWERYRRDGSLRPITIEIPQEDRR